MKRNKYLTENYLKTIIDPDDYSGECYPDGTPKTNLEYFRDKESRNNDFH